MRTNLAVKRDPIFTHEGARAVHITPEQALRRSVLSCMLWEREFYEDGKSIAERIATLAKQVKPERVAALAREARGPFNLRHAPLMLLSALAETAQGSVVSDAIADVLQRADEPGELLALHAKRMGKPIKKAMTHAMRKGIARAFARYDEYQLGKYDRAAQVRLRDVLFLTHPKNATRQSLWDKLAKNELATPDTWEVELSAGKDKRETFERLIREGNLGYLALLRNLRNMVEAGCDLDLVRGAILARKGAHRVLPFRYVAAARAAPQLEPVIDQALCAAIGEVEPLKGKTVVLVDVSGSMDEKLSAKSDLKRIDAAAALASIVTGDVRVFTFSMNLVEVPPRRGMAGVDAVIKSQDHGVTWLGKAVEVINAKVKCDRLIVITDEQSHDRVPAPVATGYMINVASAKNGVGYGPWVHIDGFSEAVLRFIHEYERDAARAD
jgi:60 kDa SS-A/Ro ribonucleoprotein